MAPRRPANRKPPDLASPASLTAGEPTPAGAVRPALEVTLTQSWSGPLPPPSVLEGFRSIVPDAPERIFAAWEMEGHHRRRAEIKALNAQIAEVIGGKVLAFAFAVGALGTAAYCASLHEQWAAGIIGGATIASVVAAFVYERPRSEAPSAQPSGKEQRRKRRGPA